MPRIVITHSVADVGKWLSYKEERAGAFATMMGGSDVVDLVVHGGGNTVAVSAQVADVQAVLASVSAPPPELAAAMERHGVMPPLAVYVEG